MPDVTTISYKFTLALENQKNIVLDIKLDPKTLNLIPKERTVYPEWTKLEVCQCPVCPYNPSTMKYCPIAVNLTDVMEIFSNYESFKVIDATLVTNEREFYKHTSLQTALSSIIGIYMVVSGCQVMHVLKPLVRHHLPFCSIDETIFRTVSMYLLGQYFLKKKGIEPDWELKKLTAAYEAIGHLNRSIVMRLRQATIKDANVNAVVILDVFAKAVPISIEKTLSKIEYLFDSYQDIR